MCIRRPQRDRQRGKESATASVKGARGGQAASNLWPFQVAGNRSQQEDTVM